MFLQKEANKGDTDSMSLFGVLWLLATDKKMTRRGRLQEQIFEIKMKFFFESVSPCVPFSM